MVTLEPFLGMLRPGLLRFFKALSNWQRRCGPDILAIPIIFTANRNRSGAYFKFLDALFDKIGCSGMIPRAAMFDRAHIVNAQKDLLQVAASVVHRLSGGLVMEPSSVCPPKAARGKILFKVGSNRILPVTLWHVDDKLSVVPSSQQHLVIQVPPFLSQPILAAGVAELCDTQASLAEHATEVAWLLLTDLWVELQNTHLCIMSKEELLATVAKVTSELDVGDAEVWLNSFATSVFEMPPPDQTLDRLQLTLEEVFPDFEAVLLAAEASSAPRTGKKKKTSLFRFKSNSRKTKTSA